jgi:hypothetical protein
MPDMLCPECEKTGHPKTIRLECSLPHHAGYWPEIEIRGIMRCLKDNHEWPFVMSQGFLRQLSPSLPGSYSDALHASVDSALKEDVKEAERANWAQCYNAAVVMCRRALQLGLIQKGIPDSNLGLMLQQAIDKHLLPNTGKQAQAVKLFGDIGAHRVPSIRPEEVNVAIFASVEILNDLFTLSPSK